MQTGDSLRFFLLQNLCILKVEGHYLSPPFKHNGEFTVYCLEHVLKNACKNVVKVWVIIFNLLSCK